MKHFIGTRFNLKLENWEINKNGNKVLTESWLEQRFELFGKFCLNSMKNQIDKNFIWCLFFDIDTSNKFKEKINTLIESDINIHVIYINSMKELVPSFKKIIKENITSSDSYVVTSRIDNDDFVASNYTKVIQSLFKPVHNLVIDLQDGYQLTTDTKEYELRDYHHPFNAFISVVEKANAINTIYSKEHYHWSELEEIIKYTNEKMWIEVSHKENFVNHKQSKLRLSYSIDIKRFHVPFLLKFKVSSILKNNLNLLFSEGIDKMNQFFHKFSRLPFRLKRFTKKKVKYYALELGLIKSKEKWPYISKRLKKKFINEVHLLSSEETLNTIKIAIKNKQPGAYLRFGDGDVLLMMGYEDILHKNNANLSLEMREAFELTGSNFHKSLPIQSELFGFENNMKDGIHLISNINALNYLAVSHKFFNLNLIFSTVALHHISIINKEYCIGFLKFLKAQNPLFVGNKNTKEDLVQKLFGEIHIKTPSNNSYNEMDRIEQELVQVLDAKKEFTVVVIAMGCPGRILQKRIVKRGYNAYLFDFGSLLDALNGEQSRAWIRLTGGVDNYKAILNQI